MPSGQCETSMQLPSMSHTDPTPSCPRRLGRRGTRRGMCGSHKTWPLRCAGPRYPPDWFPPQPHDHLCFRRGAGAGHLDAIAGASLILSPTIATRRARARSRATTAAFLFGTHFSDHALDADLASDGARSGSMVAANHDGRHSRCLLRSRTLRLSLLDKRTSRTGRSR